MPASICAAWVMALTCKGSHAVTWVRDVRRWQNISPSRGTKFRHIGAKSTLYAECHAKGPAGAGHTSRTQDATERRQSTN